MGRHSRPTPAQQARANTLKAAAALGVAGTIAFGLHSSIGGDRSVEARSDVNSAQKQSPDAAPAEDNTSTGSHVTPSASAEPKPVSNTQDGQKTPDASSSGRGTHTDGGSGRHATPGTPSEGATKDTPSDTTTPPAQRADQVSTGHTELSRTPSADPTGPSDEPSEQSPSPQPKGKGAVDGVVDGVGDTLDGVIGGIGGALGG
ncbi:extensin [Streptomyces coffeae]|uniref:Extensin n=1 Tax=Streptomyces coffeae TaxID=621382 RepID=A0ABS1N6C6_9ACTN|nr:extensin [Streptomyces coffeae]MBL1095578.1 extensin [Streptomyces coffeae]